MSGHEFGKIHLMIVEMLPKALLARQDPRNFTKGQGLINRTRAAMADNNPCVDHVPHESGMRDKRVWLDVTIQKMRLGVTVLKDDPFVFWSHVRQMFDQCRHPLKRE